MGGQLESIEGQSKALFTSPIQHSQHDKTSFQTRNRSAFAVLKEDGSVVSWGHAPSAGDSSAVADQLLGGLVQFASEF